MHKINGKRILCPQKTYLQYNQTEKNPRKKMIQIYETYEYVEIICLIACPAGLPNSQHFMEDELSLETEDEPTVCE